MFTELVDITFTRSTSTRYSKPLEIPGALVADAKSLYDVMVASKLNVADRRVSLEAALIRQALAGNIAASWVKSEQMLADILTKAGVDPRYVTEVLKTGLWTLGPDPRAPSTRNRPLREPPATTVTTTASPPTPQQPTFLADVTRANAHVPRVRPPGVTATGVGDMGMVCPKAIVATREIHSPIEARGNILMGAEVLSPTIRSTM
jgi:hypothetical protein